jgi:hypothetical protein
MTTKSVCQRPFACHTSLVFKQYSVASSRRTHPVFVRGSTATNAATTLPRFIWMDTYPSLSHDAAERVLAAAVAALPHPPCAVCEILFYFWAGCVAAALLLTCVFLSLRLAPRREPITALDVAAAVGATIDRALGLSRRPSSPGVRRCHAMHSVRLQTRPIPVREDHRIHPTMAGL